MLALNILSDEWMELENWNVTVVLQNSQGDAGLDFMVSCSFLWPIQSV